MGRKGHEARGSDLVGVGLEGEGEERAHPHDEPLVCRHRGRVEGDRVVACGCKIPGKKSEELSERGATVLAAAGRKR